MVLTSTDEKPAAGLGGLRTGHRCRPHLSRPDGRPLPLALRLLHVLATRPPTPVRWAVRQGIWRLLAERLPAMVALYPDSRAFLVAAGDRMYAQLFMYGAYEPSESRVLSRLLREGDFAIDIGANHGWYSLLMASRVGPSGRVLAAEPVPAALDALQANIDRNPDLEVEVLPIALGAADGETEIHVFSGLPHGHASESTLGRDDYRTHRVPIRALDDLVPLFDVLPAVVKVDVEGAELEVLRGAAALTGSETPPIWMLEVNHETSAAFGYEPADLVAHLDTEGSYRPYRIERDGLKAEAEPESAPHGTGWVCIPPRYERRLQEIR